MYRIPRHDDLIFRTPWDDEPVDPEAEEEAREAAEEAADHKLQRQREDG
jgi:hypothetical protein